MRGFSHCLLPGAAAGARWTRLLGLTVAVLGLCGALAAPAAAADTERLVVTYFHHRPDRPHREPPKEIDRLLIGGDPLDFGHVAAGTENVDFIALSNVGKTDLLVFYITFTGLSSGQFRFCDGPPLPTILRPGQTRVLAVCFAPRYANEDYEDAVLVNSDDNILGSVLIPVTGSTKPAPPSTP